MDSFFKNWSEICKLSPKHRLLMMTLAALDLSPPIDPETAKLICSFPECFSKELIKGPIPLSILRAQAQKNAAKNYNETASHTADNLVSYDAVPDYIPIQSFQKAGGSVPGLDALMLPESIDPEAPQGTIVLWEGRRFVVMENNYSCNEMHICPTECVDVNA